MGAISMLALGLGAASGVLAEPAPLIPEIVVRGFGDDAPFTLPQGIAIDPTHGEILVADTGRHAVEIFSRSGKPLFRFVHEVRRADGSWVDGSPSGLAAGVDGRIYIVDMAAPYVDVVDGRGRPLSRLEPPAEEGAGNPGAVMITRTGLTLVATSGDTGRIHCFNRDGSFRRSWGTPGPSPGQLRHVRAMAEAKDGSIAVLCTDTQFAVQRFSAEGSYLDGFARHEIGPGNVSLPSGLAITEDGRLWVSDELRQSVQVFDNSGRFLRQLGQMGEANGEFLYPSAVASDGSTRLAVIERVGARFQLFRLPEE
ncbi:MAG TPA: 6-bladed beta-propeller [Candidatus Eisenbacteria bacterium]